MLKTVDPATSSVSAAETLSPAMDVEVNRVLQTLTGSASTANLAQPITSSDPNITEVAIAEAVDSGAVNSDQAMLPISYEMDRSVPDERVPPQTPVPEAARLDNMDVVKEMDVDTPLPREDPIDATSRPVEQDELVTEPSIYTPADFQAIIQNMVNDVNRLIASVNHFLTAKIHAHFFFDRIPHHHARHRQRCFRVLQ